MSFSSEMNNEKEENNENKEKKEHKQKEIFKKIIENIIEIDIEKDFIKKKSNSFFYLKVFKNQEFFKNIQIINKKHTDDIATPYKRQFLIISSLKYVTDLEEKKDAKKQTNLSQENKEESKDLKKDNDLDKSQNHLAIKRNSSSSKLKTSFCRNFILKSELYKNYKKKLEENEKKKNDIKIFKKIKPEENQTYNYYYNNINNLKDNKTIFYNNYENSENEIKNKKREKEIYKTNNNDNKTNQIYLPKKELTNIRTLENKEYMENKKIDNKSNQTEKQMIRNDQIKEKELKNNINNSNNIEKEKKTEFNISNYNDYNSPQIHFSNININNNNNNINNNNFFYNQANNINYFPVYYYPYNKSRTYYSNSSNIYQYNNNLNNYNPNMQSRGYYHWQNVNNQLNNNIINNNINNINNLNNDNIIAKNALNLIRTQSGCHLLKEKSISNHSFANDLLFPEIKNNLKEICCNFIPNSLIKTLIDILSYDNIDLFLTLTQNSLYDICLTESGSRVFQKIIERIHKSPLLLNKFMKNLKSKNIGILINSAYGNHIFHKYLSLIENKEYTKFIYNYIFGNFIDIVNDKHGVSFIQKCIFEADDEQRNKIYDIILFYLDNIMKHCYGNYVIHYIFSKSYTIKINEISKIIIKIEENIIDFCKSKYSSSVIEKCFEKGNQEIGQHILKHILENHSNSIIDILLNSYGFYVIKKAMRVNNNDLKDKLTKIIVNNLDNIEDKYYVNRIITNFTSEYKGFSDFLFEKNKKSNL